jgi:hypothetical protein
MEHDELRRAGPFRPAAVFAINDKLPAHVTLRITGILLSVAQKDSRFQSFF